MNSAVHQTEDLLFSILLQLIGHLPGVIYGIYQVTRNNEPTYY